MNEYEKSFYDKIKKDFLVEESNNKYKKYIVELQGNKFKTYMSDEELRRTVVAGINIIHELMEINKNGLTKEAFQKAYEKAKEEHPTRSDLMMDLHMALEFLDTEKIIELKRELCEIRRVGGAFELLIARPVLNQALYVVYEASVDNWDNMEVASTYFMIRCLMRMNSEDIYK